MYSRITAANNALDVLNGFLVVSLVVSNSKLKPMKSFKSVARFLFLVQCDVNYDFPLHVITCLDYFFFFVPFYSLLR